MKETYDKFRKKYNLPTFEKLDSEFNLEDLKKEFLLKKIIEKIHEKYLEQANSMEEILKPNSELSIIYEQKQFTEKDEKTILDIFVRLMKFVRESEILYLEDNEKDEINFIKESYNSWMKIKEDILKILKKRKSTWENLKENKEKINYFG